MAWSLDENDKNHLQIVLGYGDVGVALATYKGKPEIAGMVFVPLYETHEPGTDLSQECFITPERPKISIRVDNLKGLAAFKRFYEHLQKTIFGTEITNGMNMVNYLMEENSELKEQVKQLEAQNKFLTEQLAKGNQQ